MKNKRKLISPLIIAGLLAQASFAEQTIVAVDDNIIAQSDPYFVLGDKSGSLGDTVINITGGSFKNDAQYYNRSGVFIGSSSDNSAIEINKLTVNFDNSESLYKDTFGNLLIGSMPSNTLANAFNVTDGKYINLTGGKIGGTFIAGNMSRSSSSFATTGGVHTVISNDTIIGDNQIIMYNTSSLKKVLPADSNGLFESSVYGADTMANFSSASVDYVDLTIKDDSVVNGFVFTGGGKYAYSNFLTLTGANSVPTTKLTITDNAQINGGYVFGGISYMCVSLDDGINGDSVNVYGDTSVNISGNASIKDINGEGYVFGGSFVTGGLYDTTVNTTVIKGNTNVNITGGSNENLNVFGGGFSQYDWISSKGDVTSKIDGNTNVLVENTEVGNVYGAGRLSSYESNEINKAEIITGDTNITLNNAVVNGDVYAGGFIDEGSVNLSSTVNGNANITVKGTSSVAGVISGKGANGAIVEGTSTLNLGTAEIGHNASLNNVTDFDVMNVSANSSSTINGTISNVETLNINGDLTVNNSVDVSSLNINGSLNANIKEANLSTGTAAYVFKNDNMSLTNNGTLNLVADKSLAEGTYNVFANTSVSLDEKTKVYGGSLNDSNQVVLSAVNEKLTLGSDTGTTVEANARVDIQGTSSEGTSVSMYFNSANETIINKVTETTSTDVGFEQIVDTTFTDVYVLLQESFDFDLSLASGDEVVLSFFINDANFDLSQFTIFHSDEKDGWGEATNVSDISYDGETLSFIVDDFSSYGYTVTNAIPEPSTYAMIFGVLALGFAYYRRRK